MTPDATTPRLIHVSAAVITDADGASQTLAVNPVGNFYSTKSVAFPIHAKVVDTATGAENAMTDAQTTGNCNGCHTGTTYPGPWSGSYFGSSNSSLYCAGTVPLGGDDIGKRQVNYHLMVLQQLGELVDHHEQRGQGGQVQIGGDGLDGQQQGQYQNGQAGLDRDRGGRRRCGGGGGRHICLSVPEGVGAPQAG